MKCSKLFIVPTPIGNLQDITLRALDVLRQVDIILAEDTRVTRKLLSHFNITEKKVWAYHKFNEHEIVDQIISHLKAGLCMALVSDAGTPGISDPGFLLVRKCIENDIDVEVLPGPTAFVPALVASGLPCDRFVFEGFLPHKKGRTKRLTALKDERRTMVFYESPYRLLKTLEQFIEFFGPERKVVVAKEISKIHEQYIRGTLAEVLEYFKQTQIRGEYVIILAGKD